MTALKKPIKIKVIDEDEIGEFEKKPQKNKEELKVAKEHKVVAATHKTGKKSLKKVVIKKEEKSAKKNGAKKVNRTKKISVEKKEVLEIDPIEEAFNKVSAVKNIVMSSNEVEEEETDIISSEEKDVLDDVVNIENEESQEDAYDIKDHSVRDIIASSINMEQEKQEKKIETRNNVHTKRSIAMYRKIAVSFIVFTVLLVAVIFYFSSLRVTIVLIPNQERINSNVIFDVYDNEADEIDSGNLIEGVVQQVRTEVEEKFEATGETILGQEAVSTVVIYNNHNKNQPLVATTRLLPVSEPDKLFRISNTVDVPAGGSVKVDIYADEPGPDMAIEATKFTIPGLWAGLQDKIYAESSEKVEYQQKVKKYILQDDIDNSERYLKQKLVNNVKLEIDSGYSDYGKVIYKTDENSIETSFVTKVNDEVDKFDVTMSANVVVVAFDSEKAADFAEQKFVSSLSEGKEMLSFDKENIIYSLNNYNLSDKTATINATFEGRVSLKDDSNIVDKGKIVGLNKQQLGAYLKELPDIAGYEIKFYPPFINKIPKLIELSKIKIEIKK